MNYILRIVTIQHIVEYRYVLKHPCVFIHAKSMGVIIVRTAPTGGWELAFTFLGYCILLHFCSFNNVVLICSTILSDHSGRAGDSCQDRKTTDTILLRVNP